MQKKSAILIILSVSFFLPVLVRAQEGSDIQKILLDKIFEINRANLNQNMAFENDTLNILSGNLLSNDKRHVFIRYNRDISDVYIGVFEINEPNKYKDIFTHSVNSLEFIGDSLLDVNQDGFNDLIIKTYPSSGCCIRDVSNIYLYNGSDFAKPVRLLNAIFTDNKEEFYTMSYGQPGTVHLSKKVFSGDSVNTLEEIFHGENHGFLKQVYKNSGDTLVEYLSVLPEEYNSLGQKYLDWFYGK